RLYSGDILFFYSEKDNAFEFYNLDELENEISKAIVDESLFRIRAFEKINFLMDYYLKIKKLS
uniref:hypothetical protein n=1 Tax=Eubacterium sp. TaxID=142586 RepID=UPI0025D54BC6